MPIIESAAGIIMTFKFTFSAHVCLKFTFKIFCWMSLVCQVFKNQFIVSLPPKTFFSFCDGCFSDGMTMLGQPDAWEPFSVSSFPSHSMANSSAV